MPRCFNDGVIAVVRQGIEEPLALVAPRSVQLGRKHGDDFQDVLGQLFLEARLFTLMDQQDAQGKRPHRYQRRSLNLFMAPPTRVCWLASMLLHNLHCLQSALPPDSGSVFGSQAMPQKNEEPVNAGSSSRSG